MQTKSIYAALLALAVITGVPAQAQRTFEVTVTNLTKSQIMSPPLVVTHSDDIALFEAGAEASPELAAIAEDAVYDDMILLLEGLPEVHDFAIGGDVIVPGGSMTVRVEGTRDAPVYSVLGMLVVTNDTFYAFKKPMPLTLEKSTRFAIGYDSGSEANTEDCAHIPGPPCDNPFVRVTEGAEGFVYVSPGIHNVGSLDSSAYDWRSPVAMVSIAEAE